MSIDSETALEDLKLEVLQAEQSGDSLRQAAACSKLGQVLFGRKQYQQAAHYYQQASQIYTGLARIELQARALNHLGVCWIMADQPADALNCLTLALESLGSDPEPALQAVIHGNLGLAYSALRDHKRAFEAHKTVMEAAESLGNENLKLQALINLADCSLQEKRYRPAQGFALVALDLARKHQAIPAIIVINDLLGMIFSHLGDLRSAVEYHQNAYQTAREAGDLLRQGIALANLGLAQEGLTELALAAAALEEAEGIFSSLNSEYMKKTRSDLKRIRRSIQPESPPDI